jgi:polysaccharide export outer membrane protein
MSQTRTRTGHRIALASGSLGLLASLTGCHWDSFMDPSVVGRWEETPAVVPVLEQLAPIESDGGSLVEYTDVTLEDLQVQSEAYTISSADEILLEVWDVVIQGQAERYERVVDQNGYIEVPQLGRVFVSGLTEEGAADLLRRRFGQFITDPLVSVNIVTRRAQSYHLQGAVAAPGRYQIPSSDYRLLEAVIAGGGVDSNVSKYVHVIRQVSLSDEASPSRGESGGSGGDPTPLTEPGESDNLMELIDDLTGDEDGGAPGVMGTGIGSFAQPSGDEPEPVIDLIEEESSVPARVMTPDGPAQAAGGGRWMFLNGKWVRGFPEDDRRQTGRRGGGVAGDGGETPLVTQRVIRVPAEALIAGDARYNLVVRPGDVISVPPPETGNVYIGGQVNRPGVYQLPAVGRLTLHRAMTAAGGLGGIAIPERVDLTRMVGPDRQATIMLDLRAIAEGTQPDVFLKPDDHINVGTNFFALPLAVVRNGFRASYGFGFLLDRNFGNDIFGAPPVNLR